MAGVQLFVEMGKLPACVFQKEAAVERKDSREEIEKEDSEEAENQGPVCAKENELIRDEEFEFAHEPESEGEDKGDS